MTAFMLLQTNTVRAMNYLTALFFAVDAVMKMVAQGVLFTPTAYFQVLPLPSGTPSCPHGTCLVQ